MILPGVERINSLYRIIHEYGPDSRLFFALLMFILSLYLSFNVVPAGVLLTLPALWLIWDALRHSSVWHGFYAFRNNDLQTVRLSLSQVRWPNLLETEAKAYYHWLKGIIDVADARFAAAKVHLLVAAAGRLRTENDRSLVHCLLAEVALQEGDESEAQEHLRHARALRHHPNVERMIATLSARIRP